MFNLPLSNTLGIRVAGTYLKRDGYTNNLFNGSQIDDRDLYSVRGTLSWEPTSDTRIDLIGYYFHENDQQSRHPEAALPSRSDRHFGLFARPVANQVTNGNSTLASDPDLQRIPRRGDGQLGRSRLRAGQHLWHRRFRQRDEPRGRSHRQHRL